MKKKEIYLKAYLRSNLGDDMFVRHVAERYPDVQFRIYTSSKNARAFIKQVNIHNTSPIALFADKVSNKILGKQLIKHQIEKNAKALVQIGGSIFIEPTQFLPPKKIVYRENMFVIGCNFGPWRTDAYYQYIYSRLQQAKDVCFRDQYSYDQFAQIDHARVAPDVLFGYPAYPTPQKGHGLGISVIDLSGRPDLQHIADQYYSCMAQVVDICNRSGVPVRLLGFCSEEGDSRAIAQIIERCETNMVEVCEYSGDIDAMLNKINACEYIIASRFHAMIIGWSLAKKVLPIIYSDKQLHVINDVHYTGCCWDLRKGTRYTADELLKNIYSAWPHPVTDYRIDSERQFEKLDRYLKEMS